MRAVKWTACLLGLAVVLASCSMSGRNGAPAQPNTPGQSGKSRITYDPPTQVAPHKDLASAAEVTNDLGLRLLHHLHSVEPHETTLISPASIATALALLYNGARGKTRDELHDLLRLGDLPPERLNLALYTLNHPRQPAGFEQSFYEMHVANSLWHQIGLELQPDFDRLSQVYYQATVEPVPFGHPDAAQRINAWVNEQTRGLIPSILESTLESDVLVLVNALYLKAQWVREFDAAKTQPKPFTKAGGSQVTVPMMHQDGYFNYHEENGVQRIALPLGDNSLNVTLVLPPRDVELAHFLAGLKADQLSQWRQVTEQRKGSLALPRLNLRFSTSLEDSLRLLGLSAAFTPGSDFSPMLGESGGIAVSGINHRAVLTLDEKGVEAAAVTDIGLGGGWPQETEPFEMVVDRPFLLLIQDRSGRTLFVAAVADPGDV